MNKFPGKVVIARDKGLRNSKGKVQTNRLENLLDKALCKLGGKENARSFWRTVLNPGETVGLKINCLAGKGLSTTKEMVDALLKSLNRGGVSSDKIIVWDRSARELKSAGFPTGRTASGVRYLGTDQAGYKRKIFFSGEVGSLLSRILTGYTSALISVGVLKDHDLAGVSIGMKNLFGILHNPNKYHDNTCDPYVADVVNFPIVRKKLRLVIADGTIAQYHNAPAYNPAYAWKYNGLLAATDPVALDRVGCEILDEKRKANGLAGFKEAKRWPKWLKTAEEYGLGEADLEKIEQANILED